MSHKVSLIIEDSVSLFLKTAQTKRYFLKSTMIKHWLLHSKYLFGGSVVSQH